MWKGDITVWSCNLQAAWFAGRANAVSILSTAPVLPEEFNYDAIFSVEGVDMLCVFGGGKYPGINQEDDKEDPSIIPPTSTPNLPVEGGISLVEVEIAAPLAQDLEGGRVLQEDDVVELTFEDQLENEMDGGQCPNLKTIPLPSDDTSSPLPSGKGIHPSDYLLCKGKWVHKASVCCLLFNEGFTSKLHD